MWLRDVKKLAEIVAMGAVGFAFLATGEADAQVIQPMVARTSYRDVSPGEAATPSTSFYTEAIRGIRFADDEALFEHPSNPRSMHRAGRGLSEDIVEAGFDGLKPREVNVPRREILKTAQLIAAEVRSAEDVVPPPPNMSKEQRGVKGSAVSDHGLPSAPTREVQGAARREVYIDQPTTGPPSTPQATSYPIQIDGTTGAGQPSMPEGTFYGDMVSGCSGGCSGS